MTKQDLVKSVASKVDGATQKDIAVIIDTVIETIKETVVNGEKVSIAGFGNFDVIERAARKGRNPQTSEEIMIPATKTPKFKAAKAFKDVVNA